MPNVDQKERRVKEDVGGELAMVAAMRSSAPDRIRLGDLPSTLTQRLTQREEVVEWGQAMLCASFWVWLHGG
jgi:hypothetical protein